MVIVNTKITFVSSWVQRRISFGEYHIRR